MTEEKINVGVFNWGPCIIRFKISDECKKLLLDESKRTCLILKLN